MWHTGGMNTQNYPPEVQKAIESFPQLVCDDWEQVCGRIPIDIEILAKETKAIQRKREVKSARDLLRLVLAYAVCDWPLRLVGAWATALGMCSLSDVAVRKRLRCMRAWLGRIIAAWLQQQANPLSGHAVSVRLIDATSISHPGSQGTDWRLHVRFDLGTFSITGIELTDAHGGETLKRHPVQGNEISVADRAYAHRNGLGAFLTESAPIVVRANWANLPMETADGQPFDVLDWLRDQPGPWPCQFPVWLTTPQGRFEVRLIVQRLPEAAAQAARRRARRRASRQKGRMPSQDTLFAADFILLITNLPESTWPPDHVLALYRLRWQIELLFKRLKGILNLDHLRAKDPILAQVYLMGKLLGGLLLEGWSHDWATTDLANWFNDTRHPVSLWRWTGMWADLLRQAIRGPLTLARWIAALPRLARYLRDAPRKRRQQAAWARQWLNALAITPNVLNTVSHLELESNLVP